MSLAITGSGTVAALPLAPYSLSDQGGTVVENSIPRGAYDARADIDTSLYAFSELNQFIAIIADAYDQYPMAVIVHLQRMLTAMIGDRSTGQG